MARSGPLHPLIKTLHVAFKVDDLQDAIRGEELLLRPYEPIDGYFRGYQGNELIEGSDGNLYGVPPMAMRMAAPAREPSSR